MRKQLHWLNDAEWKRIEPRNHRLNATTARHSAHAFPTTRSRALLMPT